MKQDNSPWRLKLYVSYAPLAIYITYENGLTLGLGRQDNLSYSALVSILIKV